MKQKTYGHVFAAVVFGISCAANADDVVVKVGHVAPLSGQIAHLGKDSENGARLAIEQINERGLVVGGHKVTLQLDPKDDSGDPGTAAHVAQELVNDKVVAVVGHLNSGASIAASEIYDRAGIVEISPATTDPEYTQRGLKTTYRLVETDAQQGPALATYAAEKLHVRSVAVIDDKTAYSIDLAGQFQSAAPAAHLKVVGRYSVPKEVVDFRATLTKIDQQNPDAIMFAGEDATAGPLVRQAQQMNLRARILAGDGVCTTDMGALAGNASGNVVCSQAGRRIDGDFSASYARRFQVPVQGYAPYAYDAVFIIVDAMKRANSTDPAKILAMVPSTKYAGVTGNTSFKANGDLQHGEISFYTYKGTQQIFLDSVPM